MENKSPSRKKLITIFIELAVWNVIGIVTFVIGPFFVYHTGNLDLQGHIAYRLEYLPHFVVILIVFNIGWFIYRLKEK